ncbi:putative methyltransferase [Trifolium pratense]|uniref:Putative methyltransferase n=1 Tax=Trifolium pratense TaxID=57577 RepID=A0A2K3NW32_TRIPR|nr:putative methyltransferase [Trifolium pratense]
MGSRPESVAPPELFYDDVTARKYTSNSRIIKIQTSMTERALELLNLPKNGAPKLLLDIGCGSGLSGETITESGHHWVGLDISPSMLDIALEREVEGDLLLSDMGQGLGFRFGTFDGAIGISTIQEAGFKKPSYVVDYPESSKRKKIFLFLACGENVPLPKGKEDEDDVSKGEENKRVYIFDRHRPRKKQKNNNSGKGREWIMRKKEQQRRRGNVVPQDTKYTGRKRKSSF